MNNKVVNWLIGIFFLAVLVLLFYYGAYSVDKEKSDENEKTKLDLSLQSSEINSDIYDDKHEKVIVQTTSGSLRGNKLRVLGSKVYSFLGVRYAEPPVGKLRFSSPEPIKPWSGIRSAVDFSAMCPQMILPKSIVQVNYISENISEDCLTLNIWTPEVKPKKLKTVMVWIHGGGFLFSSANFHETDGQVLASVGDVVVVSINYRIGVFGFLNTRTEGAPGNMGIYDQSLALHWIKNNINRFGGDPEKIVPFGQSAGAISIGILMSYNKTRNLFSRAITQSGGFILTQNAKTYENSLKFAKLVGCIKQNEREYMDYFLNEEVECLKNISSHKLLEATNTLLNTTLTPFMPSLDTYYEDIESPTDYLQEDDAFSNVKEVMTGLVRDEGSFFMMALNPKIFTKHSYPELKTLEQTRKMFIELTKNKTDIPENIASIGAENFILGPERDSSLNNIRKLSNALANIIIACPTIYLADELISRNKTVYMYLFNHRPKSSSFGKYLGVMHYEEVPFVFGYPLRKPELYSQEDIEFSKRIMKIWSHFAKTGEVIPQLGLNWPKYNEANLQMTLQPKQPSLNTNSHTRVCDLYKTIVQLNGR